MATVTDISTIPLTHLNHIDALLDKGPDWNYLTGNPANTIYYTFSSTQAVIADNDDEISGSSTALTAAQQSYARQAMDYLGEVTGIKFEETSSFLKAQVHFANANIIDPRVTAECAWTTKYYYLPGTNTLTSYDADAIVYLDNKEWAADNADLAPGGTGYETLLHELGHMLGLKHPFEGDITLPEALDDTSNTLMSYTSDGYDHTQYGDFDLAALHWLYGGDGLGGEMGINGAGGIWLDGDYEDNVIAGGQRADVLTGSYGDDRLSGLGGNDLLDGGVGDDTIDGGAGLDTATYSGVRADYVILRDGRVAGIADKADWDGADALIDVERLAFADKMVALDIDGVGGAAYRLYQAAFDRVPDQQGLGYWIDKLDHGIGLQSVAAGFMNSPEFIRLYGSSNPDNASFVTRLYQNVLDRAPDQSGFDYYMNALGHGTTKAQVLTGFSESPENKAVVVGVIGNGFDYIPA